MTLWAQGSCLGSDSGAGCFKERKIQRKEVQVNSLWRPRTLLSVNLIYLLVVSWFGNERSSSTCQNKAKS